MRSILLFLLGLIMFTFAICILSPIVTLAPNAVFLGLSGTKLLLALRILGWTLGVTGATILIIQT